MRDSKKFWKNIQEVIPNKKSNNGNIFNLLDNSTNEMIDSNNTADFINDYFTNIGPNLARNLNKPWSFVGEKPDEILDELLTNKIDILELCKEININKSSSIEHLSSEIIRDAFVAIPSKVAELFNLSFIKSEIPVDWKIAKVTPLPKTGDSRNVSNL